ncbi:MAG: T9SS type A sorting domain-containing protein [Flavobacteriales bacterium]|nr:T9SS type A sorting domain-containing protein [Flavobacteriales bacterium]
MKKIYVVFGLVAIVATVFVFSGFVSKQTPRYHDPSELVQLQAAMMASGELTQAENGLFGGSGKCAGCHGSDIQEYSMITADGWDVNVTDHWRSSIMANSAKDPFWRAKVSHETTVNPTNAVELEDKCTSCHAPLGHFGAHFDGADHYSMEMLAVDSLGLDGISCVACHQQAPENIGNFFSGELEWKEDTVYGQYGGPEDPQPLFGQPMTSFVGYEPVFGEHISKSETCAGCHTLITNTADLDGNLTGNTFVEQATYHEWLNSIYAEPQDPEAAECQGCHMPRLDEPIVISANYIFLQPRPNYALHTMVGANTTMLEMMKNNIDELGISATEAQFDTTIAYTMDMLQNQSVEMELTELYYAEDTVAFEVYLENKAGHKFPSGYPARRAFVEFVVKDDMDNVLFHSGEVQDDHEVSGQDPNFETHYQTITQEDQVQIYEQVLGDVNGNVTTVLERADHILKDNRLTPKGFSLNHEVYDTTLVGEVALADPNFNHEDGVEGSGTDRIEYKIALNGYEGDISVETRLYYQSMPPKWMEEMFSFQTTEIDFFKEKYEEQGAAPVLIQERTLSTIVTNIENLELSAIKLFPNPSSDGTFNIQSEMTSLTGIEIYDASGRLMSQAQLNGLFYRGTLPSASGLYTIVIHSNSGSKVERIFRW